MLVGTLLAVVIGSYLIITRLFPRIISWFLVRRYNLLISLGKIGLHPLCVYKFSLLRGSVRLSAEWVSLTSSLLNSKVHRPLSIQLHGVLIEFVDSGDEGSLPSSSSTSPAAPHPSSSASRGPAGPPSAPLVSPKLITVGQFTGLYLLDARAVWTQQRRPDFENRADTDNCQLVTTTTTTMAAERLTLEGTNTIRNELTAVLRADRLTGELKQSQKLTATQQSPRPQSRPRSPLAQWSGDLEIQAMVVQNETGQHLSDVSVELTRPYVLVSDQLLPRLLSLRSQNRPHPRPIGNQSASSVCRRWAGLVPRTAALTFADLVLTLGRHDNQDSSSQLVSQLAAFRLEARTDDALQEGSASLRLEELRVDAGACRLASLANLQLSLRGEDLHSSSPAVEAAVGLHTVQLSYYHSAVAEWLYKLGCIAPPAEMMATPVVVTSYSDDVEHVNWRLRLDAEFWDLDTYLVLPDLQPLNTCLTHGKFGGDRSASELVLETVTSSFGGAEPTTRRHAPGVLLVMGALLARHSTLPSSGGRSNYSCTEDPLSVSVLMDSVQVEASKAAAELLYFMLSSVSLLQRSCFCRQSTLVPPPSGQTARRSRRRLMEMTLQATNLNGFCVTEAGCTMVRVDSFDAEVAGAGATIVGALNRLALVVNLPVRDAAIVCQKTADVLSPVLRATRLKARRTISSDVTQPQQMTISARETLTLNWSPTVHEHVLLCARSLTGWADKAIDLLRRAGTTQPDLLPSKPTAGQNTSEHVETCPRRRLAVKLKGDLCASAQLAAKHHMSVCLTDLSLVRDAAGLLTMSTSQPRMSVDGQPIVTVESLHVETAATNASLSEKRRAVPDLLLKENRCLLVTIGTMDLVTPFNVDLAEALNEELMCVVRWLKKIHHVRKKQFTEDSPLPPDLCVKIRRLSMEISDNPFEVKLRDNYELLEDEYHEGLKRLRTLDKKLEELRRQHGLLQSRKVESLYSQLRERGADVYVSRSRQMYSVSAMRTRLLLMLLEDVEVTALADPLLHGTSRCISVMQALDPLSPWPDDELQFSTLWCREVVASCGSWSVSLRDYPQKLLDIRRLLVWGRLVGAEQDAIPRATRQVTVHVDAPFQHATVDRSLTALKYYYDLSADADCFVMAYGPCWEPAMSLVQLCMERVSAPSRDPSPPLPFWDKIRLKLHGRFTLSVSQMTWLLHASLDPYNTTEEMEITYSDLVIDWTEGRLVLKGDLSVYVRTASKYDDCRLLYVPNISISSKMIWTCMGDARDHHSVVPCAPDKLPEYSSNQEHDSFRAFRSQYLNLSLAVETRPKTSSRPKEFITPTILLYGSTVRWFEKLKFILSGVTRPVNKGAVFNNVRPKKSQLSRHYRNVRLALNIHSCQLSYWMSFTRQHGVDMRCGVVSLSSEHRLSLRAINDGLRHRPRAHWSVEYMNCELNDAEIWLQSSLECSPGHLLLSGPVEKSFFLSVARVSYGRAAFVPAVDGSSSDRDSSTHRLVVHSMKAAWTKNNRDAGFALFDSFTSNQQLKKNLSTEALRGINIHDGSSAASASVKTPMKPQQSRRSGGAAGAGRKPPTDPVTSPGAAPTASSLTSSIGATPSPISRLQTGQAASMLQRLIAEAESNPAPVAFSEDVNQGDMSQQTLRGVSACHGDDVLHNNWLIEMVNCQVLLKGIDTRGYVIITSSKSQVLQRVHRPVWRDCTLVSKTSWVGGLEGMQYYATVSAGGDDPSSESILWLTLDNIEGKAEEDIRDFPDIVGSGQSVGGVVSQTVGGCSDDGDVASIQLQRVVSRCRCEFFYASYGDTSVDPDTVESIPPLPRSPWLLVPVADGGAGGGQQEEPVDALTVIHHDLEVCTNSLQYTMVLDIVNNLLLYVAPHKKQTYDQLQSLRFKMQLSTEEDQRRPIQTLQNRIRSLMSEVRRLERDIYLLQRQRDETGSDRAAVSRIQGEMAVKEGKTAEKKELLVVLGQELAMMIHVYKETQLSKSQKPTTRKEAVPASFIRTNEVCIRHAKWRLTEADGQLGISDLIISNFQYTKLTKSDDSVEHLLELGYLSMVNALPNQVYREVLQPAEIQSSMPVERQRSLRVFFRERPPVGGIRVKEHLEINITPINIGMTYQFFKSILKFCFPERDTENLEEEVPTPDAPKDKAFKKDKVSKKARKESSFYVPIQKDDVEKMKERAENNMLFIYIKVPEVTVRVSYKGEKVKNLEDVHNFLLTVPTLEYHNVTWTWLDLLLAMKNDTKRVLLSQAIKQKLQIGGRGAAADDAAPVVDEESKTRMLFGAMAAPGSEKHQRRASHSTKPSSRFLPHRN